MSAPDARRYRSSIRAWRTALWLSVALAAALAWALSRPIRVASDPALDAGTELAREADSDVLIVIDYEAVRRSGERFEERDWSAAWINLAEQEFGPVAIATPETLTLEAVARARVIVLTASACHDLPARLIERLTESVEAGATLVVERPTGEVRRRFAADGAAGRRRARRFTRLIGAPPELERALASLPLRTEYVGSTRALPGATTLATIDGAPVIYAFGRGAGHLVVVDFDLGEQLVAMQQGRPAPGGWELEPAQERRPTTAQLADPALIGQRAPLADMLERYIVRAVIGRYAPLPSLWPYPDGAQGALIALHVDDRLGDAGGWMIEHEASLGLSSTLLTSADAKLTPEGAAALHKLGGEVGLLWRVAGSESELIERLGIGAVRPLARPLTFAQQRDRLRRILPIDYVRSVRTHAGAWSASWDGAFREIAAGKARVDLSYETPQRAGYSWGTGLPFLALSSRGMPLGVREIPIVVPPAAAEGPSAVELLELSAAGDHSAIAVSFDPSAFASDPDLGRFGAWLETFEAVEKTDHAMMSAYRFDAFMRARRASSLTSKVYAGVEFALSAQAAGAEASAAPAAVRRGTVLRATAEAKGRGHALWLPASIGELSFIEARRRSQRSGTERGAQALPTKPAAPSGFAGVLVPLERGFNTIDAFYAAGEDQ